MPSRPTTGRILVGLWVTLGLLYLVPPVLLFVTGVNFGISVVPESSTRSIVVQLIILLLVPWAALAFLTWRWRRRA